MEHQFYQILSGENVEYPKTKYGQKMADEEIMLARLALTFSIVRVNKLSLWVTKAFILSTEERPFALH